MVIIIVDDYAYRVLNNGLLECTKVVSLPREDTKGECSHGFDNENWGQVDPEKRNMTPGEDYMVQKFAQQLNIACPEDRLPMPSTTQTGSITQDPSAPQGKQSR